MDNGYITARLNLDQEQHHDHVDDGRVEVGHVERGPQTSDERVCTYYSGNQGSSQLYA